MILVRIVILLIPSFFISLLIFLHHLVDVDLELSGNQTNDMERIQYRAGVGKVFFRQLKIGPICIADQSFDILRSS